VLFVPSLLLVLVTGAVVDRFDRKAIVIASAATELVASGVLAAFAAVHVFRLDAVLCVVFVIGIARAFGSTAERTILINVVAPSDFLRVNALYSSAREVIVIGGPAVGGVLVALSAVAAFATSAVMLAIAIAAFTFVRLRARAPVSDTAPSLRSALEGLRFVLSQRVLLGAVSLDLVAMLLGGATALLPIYAGEILRVGPTGYGLLRSSLAVGAFAMGLFLHRRPPVRHVGRTLLVCVAAFGLATIVFAYSRNLWLSMLALALAGAFDMVSVVIRSGLVQLNTPDAMRGRVSAVEMVFIGASNELGAFESGALAQLIGTVNAVAFGGWGSLLIVVLWAFAFPALRRSDRL
jgi:MFS family permease